MVFLCGNGKWSVAGDRKDTVFEIPGCVVTCDMVSFFVSFSVVGINGIKRQGVGV